MLGEQSGGQVLGEEVLQNSLDTRHTLRMSHRHTLSLSSSP
jgi:hypothetical protein